jgi:hypothetical protein
MTRCSLPENSHDGEIFRERSRTKPPSNLTTSPKLTAIRLKIHSSHFAALCPHAGTVTGERRGKVPFQFRRPGQGSETIARHDARWKPGFDGIGGGGGMDLVSLLIFVDFAI